MKEDMPSVSKQLYLRPGLTWQSYLTSLLVDWLLWIIRWDGLHDCRINGRGISPYKMGCRRVLFKKSSNCLLVCFLVERTGLKGLPSDGVIWLTARGNAFIMDELAR